MQSKEHGSGLRWRQGQALPLRLPGRVTLARSLSIVSEPRFILAEREKQPPLNTGWSVLDEITTCKGHQQCLGAENGQHLL